MEGLTGIFGFLTGYIIPFVLVLSLLVFVHEMGHYLVGRWSGIRILAFLSASALRSSASATVMARDGRSPPFRSVVTCGSSATRMHRASRIPAF